MLIGRKEELKTLHQALIADESKFVAIYGRRRVGKTFLVREAFNNDFAFYHTGLANETNRIQLAEFSTSYFSQKMAIFVTSLMTYTTLCSNSLSLISR